MGCVVPVQQVQECDCADSSRCVESCLHSSADLCVQLQAGKLGLLSSKAWLFEELFEEQEYQRC